MDRRYAASDYEKSWESLDIEGPADRLDKAPPDGSE